MTSTAFERLTGRLSEATGYSPNGSGGNWRCPAHEDQKPSLTVTTTEDRVLVNCKAGCDVDAVLAALQLTKADLFDTPIERPRDEPTATYRYTDENGMLLFEVVRKPGKRFVQRRPDGNGGWTYNLKGITRRPLYRLANVIAAVKNGDPIVIVEGEKDVEALEPLGIVATTNPAGAGKWRNEHTEALQGAADVVIVFDLDTAGRRHAQQVYRALEAKVGSVRLAHALTGKDAADHLRAGHPLEELREVTVEQLDAEIAEDEREHQAPETIPDPTDAADLSPRVAVLVERIRGQLLDCDALDNLPDPEWLIDGIAARDSLLVLFGKPGSAKSFVLIDWSLCVATGNWWHGHQVQQGRVLYIVAEGAKGMKKRKNAWLQHNRIYNLDGIHWLPMAPNLLDDDWTEALVATVAALQPALVIIDTLSRTMPGGNENGPETMTRWVDNAERLRRATGATVAVATHTPRNGDAPRGHTSLEGAAETTIEASKSGSIVTLTNKKAKDDPEFEAIRLALVPVTLPTVDDAGKNETSCILEDSHRAVGVTDDDPASERQLLKAAWECCESNGLASGALMKASGLPESTFYRAKKALVARGALVNVGTKRCPRYAPAGEVEP